MFLISLCSLVSLLSLNCVSAASHLAPNMSVNARLVRTMSLLSNLPSHFDDDNTNHSAARTTNPFATPSPIVLPQSQFAPPRGPLPGILPPQHSVPPAQFANPQCTPPYTPQCSQHPQYNQGGGAPTSPYIPIKRETPAGMPPWSPSLKRSRIAQIELIRRLGQIRFDDSPHHYDTQMAYYRDLLYRIESIVKIDVKQLGLLFLFQNLKVSHPTVHDALAPAIMDGSITEEMLETRMQYYFEMRAAQIAPSQQGGPPPIPGMALPAFTARVMICNHCKTAGHTIEFCLAPGGRLAGLSTYETVMCQRAAREVNRSRRDGTPNGSGNSTTVVINGLHYRRLDNAQNNSANVAAGSSLKTR